MPNASSKRRKLGAHVALGLLAAFSVQPALAQPARFVAAKERVAEPARPIALIIAQEQLATSIELGRIAPQEGGLIGALVNRTPEKLAQSAATKAYRFAKPLRAALTGFDAQPLALEATQTALAGTPWFAAPTPQVLTGKAMAITAEDPIASEGDTTVSMTFAMGSFDEEANDTAGALNWAKERKRLEQEFAASNGDAKQIALISWRYQMSADFTNIQVIADISLKNPKSRAPLFEQQVISVVKLRRPTFVEEENVAIWGKDDGALARRALAMAFARAGEVLPAVLALDKNGYAKAIDKKKNRPATGAGFFGPQLLRDEKGPVFFAKDGDQRLRAFVAVQTIRN